MNRLILICILIGLTTPAFAQEKLTLTTPIAQPTLTGYTIDETHILSKAGMIGVTLGPDSVSAAPVVCWWGSQTRTVQGADTSKPPVVTPKVGLSCTNGYQNINAPTGYADAPAFIAALKKNDGTKATLDNKLYAQLKADGALTGTVTGTPQ